MDKFSLRIKQLPGTQDIPLPQYMTDGAAGMDLRAAIEGQVSIAPGDYQAIPTGICIALPKGFEAQIRPRSGLALKHGLTLLNTPGTIDADYRGEIQVLLINFGKAPFVVKRGDRIAQMVIGKIYQGLIQVVEMLDETERNDGGFGHTGV
jgi:dUTP pyrophosphatase